MFQGLGTTLAELWSGLSSVLWTAGFSDLLDILVVAFLIYSIIRLVRETRAMQLVKGITLVLIINLIASYLNMITLTFIISTVLNWGIVALAIVFQPELRRALEQVGRSRIYEIGRRGEGGHSVVGIFNMIDMISRSVISLSESAIGALLVIERETKLGDVISTGTVIDSEPSVPLMTNLFYPNTPLHDGAMILRGSRLYAAGCYLPLSSNDEIGWELGTRHRAALGMSEVSDAIVVVVSEETGTISVAINGSMRRGFSQDDLSSLLAAEMVRQGETHKSRKLRRKPK